jgi:hypothetical protein
MKHILADAGERRAHAKSDALKSGALKFGALRTAKAKPPMCP